MTDGERLVFTPIESSNATEKHVKEIRANDGDGMPLYIPSLDYSDKDNKGFLPVKRGEIIMVMGRPGSGKTGFKLRWARARANYLRKKAHAPLKSNPCQRWTNVITSPPPQSPV